MKDGPNMDENGILKQSRIETEALGHTKDALLAMIVWPVEGKVFTRKLSGLRFLTRWFQQQVERLFAIEEHDGYMSMVLEVVPNLSSQIEALQDEHSNFQSRLAEIVTKLERVLPDDLPSFDRLCDELRSFTNALDEHTRKEHKLIQDAFSQDLGGEGGI